jgi:hypothetical protein
MAQDVPENEQAFVTYQLQGDNLIRAESLRAVHVEDQKATSDYRKFVVVSGVKRFALRFWDQNRGEWVSSWDTERAETKDRLPGAVDIDLQFESEVEPAPGKQRKVIVLRTSITLAQSMLKRVPPPTQAPVTRPEGAPSS